MLRNACINSARWLEINPAAADSAGATDRPIVTVGRLYRYVSKGFGRKQAQYCVVDLYDSQIYGTTLDISFLERLKPAKGEYVSTPKSNKEYIDEGGGDFGGVEIMGQPIIAMYDPATRIGDIAELMRQ